MNSVSTEYRLLSALRNPQNHHIVWRVKPELFTEQRKDVFEALRKALQAYGHATTEALEHFLQATLPVELDIPNVLDPTPMIDELARLFKKRALLDVKTRAEELYRLYDPDITELQTALTHVTYVGEADSSLTLGISNFLADLHAKESGTYRWLDTGVPFLNNMLGGEWPRGELTLVTGGTGRGKTALMNTSALNMARMARDNGTASPCIFSLEMPKAQLISRFVSDITGIDSAALRLGRFPKREFSQDERDSIIAAVNELQNLPLPIFDQPAVEAPWIIAQAREVHRKSGVECFFLDYLQLMRYEGDSKHYGLSDAGKAIRNFAKEQNVAFIALAQIHADGRLRDVGDTDRDAGVIIQLDIDKTTTDDNGVCTAHFEVTKNRHGLTGKYTGSYDSRHVRFL